MTDTRPEPISVTYELLMVIAYAADVAKKLDCAMYVCKDGESLVVTYKYPEDRKNLIAKCWPGGRRELKVPILEVDD